MNLRSYCKSRMLVLNPNDPVLEAARAIEETRAGSVIVQDRGHVVGMVTDRDLAVRALGRSLDPNSTKIREIMSASPAVLTPSDDVQDAIKLMQQRNVRRIPLVDGQRVVGMVTLDDLLLDEAAPLEELAAIVAAQIGEGGLADSPRAPARRRSMTRAQSTLGNFVHQVREQTGLENNEQAREALDIVLSALVQRMTANEARDFISQLPSLLQPSLQSLLNGPDKSIDRASIEAELAQRLNVDNGRAAQLLIDVAGAILASISPGQAEDMRRQLPKDLRQVLTSAAPQRPQ